MAIKTKKLLIALPLTLLLGLVAFYHLFPETVFTLLVRADRSASGLAQHQIRVDGLQFDEDRTEAPPRTDQLARFEVVPGGDLAPVQQALSEALVGVGDAIRHVLMAT